MDSASEVTQFVLYRHGRVFVLRTPWQVEIQYLVAAPKSASSEEGQDIFPTPCQGPDAQRQRCYLILTLFLLHF